MEDLSVSSCCKSLYCEGQLILFRVKELRKIIPFGQFIHWRFTQISPARTLHLVLTLQDYSQLFFKVITVCHDW